MQILLTSILATGCFITLLIYDLISLCRIIGKEKWVEKACKSLFPSYQYNEKVMFGLIRPCFLSASMILFMTCADAIVRLPGFFYFLYSALVLSFINSAKTIINTYKNK